VDPVKREILADFPLLRRYAGAFSQMMNRQMNDQIKVVALQVLVLISYVSFTQFGNCTVLVFQISYLPAFAYQRSTQWLWKKGADVVSSLGLHSN